MQPARSEVFAKTYQEYLRQIRQIDYFAKADMLGLERLDDTLRIPIYNSLYWLSDSGVKADDGGEVSVPLQVIICKYILTCSLEPVVSDNRLQPYREFKDAAPLISHFTTNTTQLLEKSFTGRCQDLEQRCLDAGGKRMETEVYDLSFCFHALPRIPVLLNFNDSDELFPAACSILYNTSAAKYLDMECLSMTGTHLSGLLTNSTVL